MTLYFEYIFENIQVTSPIQFSGKPENYKYIYNIIKK